MKYLSIDTIRKVVALAKKAYPKNKNNLGTITLDKVPDPGKEYCDLLNYVDSLTKEEIAELVSITYLGSGSIDIDNYELELKHNLANPQNAGYITSKKMLADHLEKGLDKLSKK